MGCKATDLTIKRGYYEKLADYLRRNGYHYLFSIYGHRVWEDEASKQRILIKPDYIISWLFRTYTLYLNEDVDGFLERHGEAIRNV